MSDKKHGALKSWINLRISAIALIPLTFWAVYSIIKIKDLSHADFTQWLNNPINGGLLIAFLLATFYHAALGVQEVYEDYISCEKGRKLAICSTNLAFLALAVISVGAVVRFF
jgi:succinate dehydrogenase / fumarate reductase membrane anchor subunit